MKNPDGSVVVELLNRGETDARYAFRVNGNIVRFEVPRDTLSAILLTAGQLLTTLKGRSLRLAPEVLT